MKLVKCVTYARDYRDNNMYTIRLAQMIINNKGKYKWYVHGELGFYSELDYVILSADVYAEMLEIPLIPLLKNGSEVTEEQLVKLEKYESKIREDKK